MCLFVVPGARRRVKCFMCFVFCWLGLIDQGYLLRVGCILHMYIHTAVNGIITMYL